MQTVTALKPVEAAPEAAGESDWRRTLVYVLLIVVFTGGTFWRVWLGSVISGQRFDFVDWDDPRTIAANPDFNPPSFAGMLKYWKAPYLDLYIPVTYTVWTGVAQIAKLPVPDDRGISLDPYPFHAINLLAHILSAVLVFGILRLLVKREWAALLGALVFALHPVQVEPVAWVSGFKDTLSGMFTLAAIWQYLLYAMRRHANEEPHDWQIPYLLATAFFLLAILSKPSAIVLPIIVGIIDLVLLRRPWDDVSGPLWIWLLMSLAFVVVGRMAQPAKAAGFVAPFYLRPLLALDALAFHLYHVVYPVGLVPDYGLSPERILKMPLAYVIWLAPAAIAVGAYFCRNRCSWATVGAGVFAAAVLPVLGFLPFDFQYYSTIADRYLYVAMLGPALIVAFVLSRWPKIWLGVFTGAAIVTLAVLSYRQTGYWRDTQALFEHTLAVNRDSFVAHQMLGKLADRTGNSALAIEHYTDALATKPHDPDAEYNLANDYVATDRVKQALPHFEAAIKARPSDPDFYHNYGDALRRLNRLEDASKEYARAAAVAPPGNPTGPLARSTLRRRSWRSRSAWRRRRTGRGRFRITRPPSRPIRVIRT